MATDVRGVGLLQVERTVISGRFFPPIRKSIRSGSSSDDFQLHNVEHLTPNFSSAVSTPLRTRPAENTLWKACRFESTVRPDRSHLNGFDGNAGPSSRGQGTVEYNKGELIDERPHRGEALRPRLRPKTCRIQRREGIRFCLMPTGIKSQDGVANLTHLEIDLGQRQKTFGNGVVGPLRLTFARSPKGLWPPAMISSRIE